MQFRKHRFASVIGQRGVLVIDISQATISDANVVNYNNIQAMRLSIGDKLDLNTFELFPASFKTNMKYNATSDAVLTTDDVFAEDTFQFDVITNSLFKTKATST